MGASMLLALVGGAAAAAGEKPVELVLALKEGDNAAWAQKHASTVRVTAYNKGQPLSADSPISEVALANVGREAHAYLYHIVHRFDSLAPKTVFMPGGLPTAGFQGFAQAGASLLPGVKVEDYLSPGAEELFVPTMALSRDLKQFSVRMSLMDNKTEGSLNDGKRFSVCSAEGVAGWSPFLPNKFATSVLEPLMTQQHAKWDFPSFWSRYMSGKEMPERVMAAHGAAFSVTRDSIRAHPKAFYETLLAELEGSKDPYQAFFLEHLWWYIFHPEATSPCGADVATPETRKAASRALVQEQQQRRRLATAITVLTPYAGQVVEFGSTVSIDWTSTHKGWHRVELWRYGSHVARMHDSKHVTDGGSAAITWHVYPGPTDEDAPAATDKTKTYNAQQPAASGATAGVPTWFHFSHGFQPGDKYTIRVCGYSEDPNEQICDNVYGESGEFDITGVIDMLTPVKTNTYKAGDYVPITWQSYWMGSKVDLLIRKDGHAVFESKDTTDDGVFTFYISHDMKPGEYEITVSETGKQCGGGSCKTFFTLLAPAPTPEPTPAPQAPATSEAPADPAWEVPIIQAFKGTFGLDEIKNGPSAKYPYSTTSTVPGGTNCEYVCHVKHTSQGIIGRRSRRLLFGGLQAYYDPVDTNVAVGCTEDMVKCGCTGC